MKRTLVHRAWLLDIPGGMIGGLILGTVITAILFDFAGRLLFAAPLIWVQEVSGMLLTLYFGLAMTTSQLQDAHVSMDFLYKKFPFFLRAFSRILTCACALIFFFPLALRLLTHSLGLIDSPRTLMTANIVTWPFYLFLAFAVFIFCFTVLWWIGRNFRFF